MRAGRSSLLRTPASLKLAQKELDKVKIVVNGGGSAGLSITRKLLAAGATDVTVVDRFGYTFQKHNFHFQHYL